MEAMVQVLWGIGAAVGTSLLGLLARAVQNHVKAVTDNTLAIAVLTNEIKNIKIQVLEVKMGQEEVKIRSDRLFDIISNDTIA